MWRARNPERANAIAADCRQRNRAKIAASWRTYYKKNKAKLYEKKKAYMARNPDKVRLWKHADYETHRESYIARAHRRWREKNDECRAYERKRYRENKAVIRARHRDYVNRNRERVLAWRHSYLRSARGRALKQASDRRCAARVAAYKSAWARRNRDKITTHLRIRRQTDLPYAIACGLRSRINQALRKYPHVRLSASMMRLLGCTANELLQHLESRFLPGMSRENRKLWHIDHIRPLASFDLTDPEQQRIACHYTNLQPLWARDNFRKGKRYSPVEVIEQKERRGGSIGAIGEMPLLLQRV
jgi:hypothetical protein